MNNTSFLEQKLHEKSDREFNRAIDGLIECFRSGLCNLVVNGLWEDIRITVKTTTFDANANTIVTALGEAIKLHLRESARKAAVERFLAQVEETHAAIEELKQTQDE